MAIDLTHTWTQTLALIAKELSKPSYETWLKSTRALALYDNTLVVAAPNEFAREWIEARYTPLLQRALHQVTGRDLNLSLIIPEDEINAIPGTATDVEQESLPPPTRPASADFLQSPLNPKYTFETFVVGNNNRLSHAAALAVAEAPAKAYNPLFIYGGVGLGKTHLMQAIGHFVLNHNPNVRVAYVTSETFTNDLINSIRDDKTLDFRNRYRNIEVLLVDDIQFLAGKERTQEEFFHTFNALHAANKQLVISSDRPPKDIPTLEERLRSRFEWGLLSDIQPPDLETRIAILRKKAELEGLSVPDDVMLYIASRIEKNIRELEGALIRVVALSSLSGQRITTELATQALKDMFSHSAKRELSISLIQEVVARHYDVSVEDLKLKKRTRSIAFPRQVAMYLARELTDFSLPRIGEGFGGRDHTTVLHACEKINKQIKEDEGLASIIDQIKKELKGG